MSMATFRVELDDRILRRMIQSLPDELEDTLDAVAEAVVGDIRQSFGSGPAGRSYRRGSTSHTASSPGYPPNVDTGALSGSIHVRRSGPLERTVEDGVEYGLFLEEGTSNMEARPWMTPAIEAWREKFGPFIVNRGMLRG